jgi:formylglycine-generating enzyme required for sulfatase activity
LGDELLVFEERVRREREEERMREDERRKALVEIEKMKRLGERTAVVSHWFGLVKREARFNMVYCPKGEFWMGSEDGVGHKDERSRHKVKMTQGFWIGETQVTQELWKSVMGWNPSHFKYMFKRKNPVENMTWYDCLVFCNKLSKLEGFTPCFTLINIKKGWYSIDKANVEWNRNANGYRLPTEAEWEYCAKAGSELTYSGSNDVDEVAWYYGNSGCKTHEVKTKKANGWGLYDMSGNVGEWCMDKWYNNAYQSRVNRIENPLLWENSPYARVVRGGSSGNLADYCRVAYRSGSEAGYRFKYRGFRLLRCEP